MKTIGFTFDEKILSQKTLHGFFQALPFQVDHLELAPDGALYKPSVYKAVAAYSPNHHFHMPYFMSQRKYDFAYGDYSSYDAFFSIVDYLRPFSVKKPSIIVHGSQEKDQTLSYKQTMRGLDYMLNFIQKKNIDVDLRLENTERVAATTHYHIQKVKAIIDAFKCPQLKLCYDLGHDYYGSHDFEPYRGSDVDYIHVHGKNTRKHQDLKALPIDLLEPYKAQGAFNLELLIASCQKDYQTVLIDNLCRLRAL